MQKEKPDMRDKLAGCLMGCALGDALGVPHEFRCQKSNVYTGLLYIEPEFHFQYVHRKDVIGQYSDDTEMTLCNTRTLIKNKGVYNREDTILAYQKWAATSKSMGKNTRALFKGVKTVKGYETRYSIIFSGSEDEWTQSNGSLMRCSILSFFGKNVVIEDCKLTNPHPINIDCSRVYSFLIRSSATNASKSSIIKRISKLTIHESVRNTFNDAIGSIDRNVTGKDKGWVLHAFYCACWAWYKFDSFEEGIDAVIKLGGDTDTNGAIAGALLGAKLGLNEMKNENRTSKNIKILLSADTTKGQNPIEKWLRLDDFDDIVDALHSYL